MRNGLLVIWKAKSKMKAEELYHYIAHKLSNKQWGSESVSVDLNYGCFVKFF